jgi:hypothetical protein
MATPRGALAPLLVWSCPPLMRSTMAPTRWPGGLQACAESGAWPSGPFAGIPSRDAAAGFPSHAPAHRSDLCQHHGRRAVLSADQAMGRALLSSLPFFPFLQGVVLSECGAQAGLERSARLPKATKPAQPGLYVGGRAPKSQHFGEELCVQRAGKRHARAPAPPVITTCHVPRETCSQQARPCSSRAQAAAPRARPHRSGALSSRWGRCCWQTSSPPPPMRARRSRACPAAGRRACLRATARRARPRARSRPRFGGSTSSNRSTW